MALRLQNGIFIMGDAQLLIHDIAVSLVDGYILTCEERELLAQLLVRIDCSKSGDPHGKEGKIPWP